MNVLFDVWLWAYSTKPIFCMMDQISIFTCSCFENLLLKELMLVVYVIGSWYPCVLMFWPERTIHRLIRKHNAFNLVYRRRWLWKRQKTQIAISCQTTVLFLLKAKPVHGKTFVHICYNKSTSIHKQMLHVNKVVLYNTDSVLQ